MTTYPTNIKVLDKSIVNGVMEEEDVTPQTLYTLGIDAGTVSASSRLRIKVTLSRVVGTPLADPVLDCELCTAESLPEGQILSEVATLTPKRLNTGSGSFSYVGEFDQSHEIYELVYITDQPTVPGTLFDDNTNLKLYRIRGNTFKKVRKVITTTTTALDHEAVLRHGYADEPVYVMTSTVTILSNAPEGAYIYFVNDKLQIFIPYQAVGSNYDCYAIKDRIIYLSQGQGVSASLKVDKWNTSGALLKSSTAIQSAGFTDIRGLQAFEDSVYVLANDTLVKLDNQNLAIQGSWNLSSRGTIRAFYVVSNNLAYFVYDPLGIAYVTMGNNTITDVDTSVTHTTNINFATGTVFGIRNVLHFKKIGDNPGYFYYAGNDNNIIMVIGPLECA